MKDEEKMLGVRKYDKAFSADQEEPGITLVLENGEDLKTTIKKLSNLVLNFKMYWNISNILIQSFE